MIGSLRPSRRFSPLKAAAISLFVCLAGSAQTSFTSGTVTFPGGTTGAGSPYPSNVTVSGLSGAVSAVTVKINNFPGSGSAYVGDLAWMLQDNLGHQFVMWATDTCDASPITGVTFTLSDSGSTSLVNHNNYTVANNGIYVPMTNCGRTGGSPITFPSPATNPPQSAYATTVGSATFASVFGNGNNTSPNGTWSLYTYRDSVDPTGGSFTWTLTITTVSLTTPTVTISPSIASPALTTQSPTFTATVSSSGTPVTTGSVTFTYDNGVAIGSAVSLNGSGQATSSAVTFPEGTHSVKAAYSGGGTFGPANATITYVVNHPTAQSGNQFCNTGGITLSSQQNVTGTPYPSNIVVGPPTGTNLTGAVSGVTLQLQNASAGAPIGVSLLLVDPSGHKFIPLQQTGSVTNAASNITFTLSDAGTSGVPNPWTTGTFSPTANAPLSSWPSPAPSATSGNAAPPEGSVSFSSAFGGDSPNGTWSLYPITGASGYGVTPPGSFSGWCLNFTTTNDPASTTTVTSSQNPTLESTNVTITATVNDATTHNAVTAGTVTFKEGTNVLANAVSLNSSGQASFTYSSAVEGDHYITAYYSGSTGNHAPSTSSPYDERVNHPTTNPSSGVYCNTGSISLPNTGSAPFDAAPYPSDITLPFIPGQVNSFTVTAKSITVYPQDLALLLTSPNGSPAQNLVLMANEGGNTEASNINLTFSDSGSSIPATLTASGTYKPGATSSANISFPSPAPPAANLVYPASVGSATLASAFSGSVQGVWSLFSNTIAAAPGESISGGWCLNLNVSAPVASVTKAAVGAPWTQGQQGVSYTITVINNGPGSSGDSTGTNPVTVTDTLPTGLTPATTPGSGTGWTCVSSSQTITCTNSNIVSSGNSYPTLTLFANVANAAPASVSNTASVAGGGFASVNSNTTSTTVKPAPVLSVAKSSVGTFTQGQTAEWDVTVSNTAAGSTTFGTTTVTDTLPNGYSVANYSTTSATWSCASSGVTVTCAGSQAVSGGSSFPVIRIIVNVPAASPTPVTNNVVAYGGGDLTHTNAANGTTGSNTVSVTQVPAAITANSGTTPQSALVGTAFGTPLGVTVKDAGGIVISGVTVSFTAIAGGSGQSGTFSNGTGTISGPTNTSGVVSESFTANSIAGSYTVNATVAGIAAPATFNLTNTLAAPTVTSVSSTVANGTYTVGAVVPITVTFSHAVNVTGSPLLALNSGGTAVYASGSGTATLVFTYTVAAGQNSSHLDAASSSALTLNGGTITDASSNNAVLTLPAPGSAGSLSANKSIAIDTTAPTVVSYSVLWGSQSYNVIGSLRMRLPWQISGISVVFSKPIATANVNSLTGITATGFSGLGTNTLTWTLTPVSIGSFSTALQGSGANAIKDAAGNALTAGSGFTQAFKLLWGDFNDDGVVNITDASQVLQAESQAYNILADMNGDGVVNTTDVQIVRTRLGTSQP